MRSCSSSKLFVKACPKNWRSNKARALVIEHVFIALVLTAKVKVVLTCTVCEWLFFVVHLLSVLT